jgi:hypothetical protein
MTSRPESIVSGWERIHWRTETILSAWESMTSRVERIVFVWAPMSLGWSSGPAERRQ